MKTIEQFFSEMETNDEELETFLNENSVSGTAEEFKKLVAAKAKESGALSDEELEAVSGGVVSWLGQKFYEWLDSLL